MIKCRDVPNSGFQNLTIAGFCRIYVLKCNRSWSRIWDKITALSYVIGFCRTILCKHGLCHHEVSVCLSLFVSVCQCPCSLFETLSKRINIFSNFVSPPGSHTILVF